MVSLTEYLEAKKTIAAYEEQERLKEAHEKELSLNILRARQEKCDHYFLPRGGQYSSGMQCQDCGKIIN
jgi:hypothetical protein